MQKRPDVLYVKSGTDFQNLSEIIVRKSSPQEDLIESDYKVDADKVVTGQAYHYKLKQDLAVTVIKHDITREVIPNEVVQKHVESYDEKLAEKMKKVMVNLQDSLQVYPRGQPEIQFYQNP